MIVDGTKTLHGLNRVRKSLVRFACRSGATGRIVGTFGRAFRGTFWGTFGRAQGAKTDLAADGTDDGLWRYAVEERAQGGEAGADDAKSRLDGGPEHDPIIVD